MAKTTIDIVATGKRIQLITSEQGYSVKDIQQYLDLSCPQSIYRWYKGIILPSVDNLLRLSELLNVHMEELLVKRDNYCICELSSDTKMGEARLLKRIDAYRVRLVS